MEIVLDLGGVLVSETSQVRDAALSLGVAPHQVNRPYWAARDAWDLGGSDLDYWTAVALRTGLQIDRDVAERLAGHDVALWTRLRPAAEALLAELAAAGHPASILSNAAARFTAAIDGAPWRRHLSHLFVSGELGIAKPDPRIYAHVEQVLGVPADQIAFVDDRADNVDAALARGWQAHLWCSDEDTRAWLASLGVLGPR